MSWDAGSGMHMFRCDGETAVSVILERGLDVTATPFLPWCKADRDVEEEVRA